MQQEPADESASNEELTTAKPAPAPHEENDGFLQNIVCIVNEGYMKNVGIALQIGGLLVSGTIISGDAYFDKLAEKMAAAAGDDEKSAAILRKYYGSFGETYRRKREAKTFSPETTSYIHLEDCTFSGSAQLANLSTLWRGRISAVDGFFFSRLTNNSAKDKE
ncbi:hypothetical protein Q5H92_26340 [Hymenobacter sp. M29]|uniref:Gas vesicle protein n=1 Tax=Hymenobacter mellowenesis TaxID=3063995 RepID=A0ABT9AL24_9BACT|nr:hypothetical protein [Hymenobacter sp. M29]MDO7849906.1 hypothetical protein [Hymenobacter sp. M29]